MPPFTINLLAIGVAVGFLLPAAPILAADLTGYVDHMVNPEDMVHLPGTDWVITSSDATPGQSKPAYLYAVDARSGKAAPIKAEIVPRPMVGDSTCKPMPLGQLEMSGLGLERLGDKYRLMGVNRGKRMSIEIFDVDVSQPTPVVEWTGCVLMPANTFPNDVVGTGENSFAVTVSFELDNPSLIDALERKENTGYLLEWHRGRGFNRVAHSELPLNNGVETDPSGENYYIDGWGGETMLKLPRTSGQAKPLLVDFGMRPDNMTWSPAGTLIVAFNLQSPTKVFGCVATSAATCPVPFKILEIDPKDLSVKKVLVDGEDMKTYAAATTGLELGNEIWVSSFRATKIARYRKN